MKRQSLAALVLLLCQLTACAQEPALDGREGRELSLDRFQPEAKLKVRQHPLKRAKFPVVDAHVHPRIRLRHSAGALDDFVQVMDVQNIAVCVSLDGGMAGDFDEHAKYLWTRYRDRFVIFCNVDWQGDGKPDDPATCLARMVRVHPIGWCFTGNFWKRATNTFPMPKTFFRPKVFGEFTALVCRTTC